MDGIIGAVSTLLPFLFVLSMVIFFHELGHWGVARLCGVWVESFSIGFGRPLWQRRDAHGTVWKIGWLPLGGYVKFVGDRDVASTPDRKVLEKVKAEAQRHLFFFRPLWQRASIVAAGPAANFLLSLVLLSGLFWVRGQEVHAPAVGEVAPGSAAEIAGFEPGDFVLEVDDEPVKDFLALARLVRARPDTPMRIRIVRDGEELELIATPALVEEKDRFGNVYRIGQLGVTPSLAAASVEQRSYGVFGALARGTMETGYILRETLRALWHIVIGRQSVDGLGGPILIAQLSGETASLGLAPLFNFIALISISIGLINLFPIPILDGGQLLFYAYEAVAGRPLPQRAQAGGMLVGLAVLASLFVFVTWNDIQRLLG